VFLLLPLSPVDSRAQDWLILGGLTAGEGWVTDSGSRLLMRNAGRPAALGRIRLWAGVAPTVQWQVVALVEGETGAARREGGSALDVEGLWIRYAPLRAITIDAGKIVSPMGAFGARRLETVNPLIDRPDTYPPSYPLALQVAGMAGRFDYRVAVVSEPVGDERYLPPAGSAARLVAGGGITPFIGAHLGFSYTRGPYLGPELVPLLPGGVNWRDFQQAVLAFDARLSRGYAEFHGELVFSSYDAPISGQSLRGVAAYAEAKYTWTPRFYTAGRVQVNKYPFIRARTATSWIEVVTRFYSGDIGVGIRINRNTLLKVSYQQDDWQDFLDGRAVSFQLSYQFDVADWLD
jgi:hypothetical protein